MKTELNENGRWDLIFEYKPEFEFADIYPNELQSMKSMVKYYSENGNKREKKLARALNKTLLWIERECWVMQEDERIKNGSNKLV